jgi:hypothetical protein
MRWPLAMAKYDCKYLLYARLLDAMLNASFHRLVFDYTMMDWSF